MQVVIDIPKEAYQGIINAANSGGCWSTDLLGVLCKGVANGLPLPEGHSRLFEMRRLQKFASDYMTD